MTDSQLVMNWRGTFAFVIQKLSPSIPPNITENADLQSTLSKSDTFGAGSKCPSKRDVRLIESQITGVRKEGTNSRRPFYRGVRLIEVSVKRESTVFK